jgi:protein-S-isoprenylcysteine O-methyltransferase Ste14
MIFIGKEEKQLTKAFGKEYEDYIARVDRLVPLKVCLENSKKIQQKGDAS